MKRIAAEMDQAAGIEDIEFVGNALVQDADTLSRLIKESGQIDGVLAANPDKVAEFRSGKDKLFGFFVGQVMKATEGKANPQMVNDLLKKKLAA